MKQINQYSKRLKLTKKSGSSSRNRVLIISNAKQSRTTELAAKASEFYYKK